MAGSDKSRLPIGKGSHLWEYWLHGKGAAEWQADPHPWTKLRALLVEHAVPHGLSLAQIDGLVTNLYVARFHHMPPHNEHGGVDPAASRSKANGMENENESTSMQFRSFEPDLEVSSEGDGRMVRGIAVPYGQIQRIDDSLTEEFARGAFNHQLPAIHRVGFYRDHSRDGGTLIGPMKVGRDDSAGFYGEWKISKTPAGDEALELIKDGALSQLSIGFRTVAGGSERRNGIVRRTKANLFEVAVVPQGAYGDGAVITGVRSANDGVCPHCGHVEVVTRARLEAVSEVLAGLPAL